MPHAPLMSFDYAIKYLLRDKGDYAVVEGFISALLKTQGYKDIKIIALLESESNKEDPKSKRSLADVIVEDEDHNKYIIEIERSVKDSFIHKACFNSFRIIVDNIAQNADYKQIVKVFHITLLYFSIGNGVLYHGKSIVHEINSGEKLSLHITNPLTNKSFDAVDIFPEYFFISIPSFNDIIKQEIDEWLYVMKHDDVPKNFHSPYMKIVADKLAILKMTKDERDHYFYDRKKLYSDRDELDYAIRQGIAQGIEQGIAEGIERGIAEGEKKAKIQIALNMLQLNVDTTIICSVTGLTTSDIEALKN